MSSVPQPKIQTLSSQLQPVPLATLCEEHPLAMISNLVLKATLLNSLPTPVQPRKLTAQPRNLTALPQMIMTMGFHLQKPQPQIIRQ